MRNVKRKATGKGVWSRFFWGVLVMFFATGAASYFFLWTPVSQNESKQAPVQMAGDVKPLDKEANQVPESSGMSETSVVTAASGESKEELAEEKEDFTKMFQVDENRALVLDEKTRLNIESLIALNTPDELALKLQKLSTVLPPGAHSRLVQLIEAFERYVAAVKGSYPPDLAPSNINQAFVQLQGLHALRTTYFGTETAAAFFEKEEEMNQKLLVTMRLQNENMTMDEKAHQSQLMLNSNP